MELMDAARATAIVDRAAHLDEMNQHARERVQRNAENSMSTLAEMLAIARYIFPMQVVVYFAGRMDCAVFCCGLTVGWASCVGRFVKLNEGKAWTTAKRVKRPTKRGNAATNDGGSNKDVVAELMPEFKACLEKTIGQENEFREKQEKHAQEQTEPGP